MWNYIKRKLGLDKMAVDLEAIEDYLVALRADVLSEEELRRSRRGDQK